MGLENEIQWTLQAMEESGQSGDMTRFSQAAEAHRIACELWLQQTQHMSPEKAHATMVGFAATHLKAWMDEQQPGPPPTIVSLYKK